MAVIVTGLVLATMVVFAVKVLLVVPWLIVTLAGTVVEGSPLESVTRASPVGAGPFRVTVPIATLPPLTLAGAKETEAIPDGFTIRDAVALAESYDPVILMAVATGTGLVVTVKLASVCPWGTRMPAGTAPAITSAEESAVKAPMAKS